MECPICFEAITKETGQMTTSCGHTFHFKCINLWYYRQSKDEEGDGKETCPCCRKEPGEFERASVSTDSNYESEDDESEDMSDDDRGEPVSNWVRIGPRRWVIRRSNGLQILAGAAAEREKIDPFYIPPYSEEGRAYWLLRNLFNEELPAASERAVPRGKLDTPKAVRTRTRCWGREFWVHLGVEHNLVSLDGYKSD